MFVAMSIIQIVIFLRRWLRHSSEMESKRKSYKDQFSLWRPMCNVLPEDEALTYYCLWGVDTEEFTRNWIDVEIMIGGMMYCSMTYVKAKGRFK